MLPTRTHTTEAAYRRRTRDLVARCRKALCIPVHHELDYRQFVGWLIIQKPHWSRPTWRQYKASVAFVLMDIVAREQHPLAQEALETLLPIDVAGCPRKTQKTSSTKLKRLPLRDYKHLVAHLSTHSGQWHSDLIRWLSVCLLTGLRPQEWATATLQTRQGLPVLVVRNAKATNARAHGPLRTIFLDGLTDEERASIAQQCQRATIWEQAGKFRTFYLGCAATLARVNRLLWPQRKQHITLYSARHQFAADAKASGLLPEELAALMGHAVDETAAQHYGRKLAGHDMLRVRPDPADVARVRITLAPRIQPAPLPEPLP